MIESNPITNKYYYAIRPELVLRASKLFAVTPSMLDRGAKKLYSRAVAVDVGKQSGRWGRHQKSVLIQFCEYTQMTGSDLLLPWQELIESTMNYDGKEGISPRTGNRPLSTIVRVEVNTEKFTAQINKLNIDIEQLSKLSCIPVALLQAIESGKWPDVAESTAKAICDSLNVSISDLFSSINHPDHHLDDVNNKVETNSGSHSNNQRNHTLNPSNSSSSWAHEKTWSILILIFLLAGLLWFSTRIFFVEEPAQLPETLLKNEQLVGTLWHAVVELNNKNIPIDSEIQSLWSNGVYIQLKTNQIIAHNWIEPKNLIDLPNTIYKWETSDRFLIIDLNGIAFRFSAPVTGNTMETLNTTRAFKMTLHRILLNQ